MGPAGWSESRSSSLYTMGVFVLESTVLTALAGGSFGKLATRLRVVRLDGSGRPLDLLHSLLRVVLVCLVVPAGRLQARRPRAARPGGGLCHRSGQSAWRRQVGFSVPCSPPSGVPMHAVRPTRARLTGALAALALAVTLTACGSDDSDSGRGPGSRDHRDLLDRDRRLEPQRGHRRAQPDRRRSAGRRRRVRGSSPGGHRQDRSTPTSTSPWAAPAAR